VGGQAAHYRASSSERPHAAGRAGGSVPPVAHGRLVASICSTHVSKTTTEVYPRAFCLAWPATRPGANPETRESGT
jgi:hypothetical protein